MVPSPTDPTKMLYVYRLPSVYSFDFNGDFPVRIIVENPSGSNDGCTGEQEIDYDVRVFATPHLWGRIYLCREYIWLLVKRYFSFKPKPLRQNCTL